MKSSIQKATAKAEAASLVVGQDRCWFSTISDAGLPYLGNLKICQDLVPPSPTLSNKADSVGFQLLLKLLHGPVEASLEFVEKGMKGETLEAVKSCLLLGSNHFN